MQKDPTVPISERSKRPSMATNENKDNKTSLYKRISKDNMNLLGLNV